MGFAWNFGNPMTFNVLQCNTNIHKRNMVVHRSGVVPHTLTVAGYNSALAPRSDAYFSDDKLGGRPNIIPVAPYQHGTVYSSYIVIVEW